MKKNLILMAAASAFVLTSCTENDLSGGTSLAKESSSAIEFSANARNAGTTRAGYAGDLTNNSIKEATAGFGVFAYYSDNQTISAWGSWDPTTPVAITKAPNFMYNEGVTWSADKNGWIYDPVKYWPNGNDKYNPENTPSNTATEKEVQYLSFFAYAPFVEHKATEYSYNEASSKVGSTTNDAPTGGAVYTIADPTQVQNGIVAMSKNNAENDMYVKYILNPAATSGKFVDLTWGIRGQNSYAQTSTTANDVNPLGTAYNTDLTKQIVGEKVKFLFKHALARVGGNTSKATSGSGKQVCGLWVVVDVDKNSSVAGEGQSNQTDFFAPDFNKAKTLVTIEEVKIRDKYTYDQEQGTPAGWTSDFLTDGWFDIMNGKWSNTASVTEHTTDGHGVTYSVTADADGTPQYKLNPAIKENTAGVSNASGADWNGTNSGGATGVNLTKEPVYAEDEDVPGLLLIPGETGENTLYVTVRYRVRTADPNLSTGFTNVVQEITNKVTLANNTLNPNKYYNLVMHLGLTSVKFEAVVADWANGSDTYDEEGSEITPSTGIDNSVWLPSNVVAYKVNQDAEATATSASIDISSYKIGNYVSNTVGTDADVNDVTGTGTTVTVNFDAANTTVTDNVNVITIVGDAGKVTVTLTHKAGAITLGAVSKATDIAAAGETITIGDVKAGTVAVPTAGAPGVTITATQVGGTYTTGLTGSITADGVLSIVVPANTGFAATWTISKIKIGDAEYVPSPAITLGQLAPAP